MPRRTYFIQRGEQMQQLDLTWRGLRWRDFTVALDGKRVGQIDGGVEALRNGRKLTLPDGSVLSLRLMRQFGSVNLEVLHNGTPVIGSDTDPTQKMRVAYGILLYLGAVNIMLGILGELAVDPLLTALGFDWVSAVVGFCLFALALIFRWQISLFALVGAIALYVVYVVLGWMGALGVGEEPSLVGILVRVSLVWLLVQAVPATRQLLGATRPIVD